MLKLTAKSFDYAILEKTKQINAIKLDIPWSDLRKLERDLKNVWTTIKISILRKRMFFIDHGADILIYLKVKEFLIKELFVKPKGILSLQKHHHRAEHWLVTQGSPKITLNKVVLLKELMNIYLYL